MTELLKKLSVKHVCGAVKDLIKDFEKNESSRPIMRVYGLARDSQTGESEHGGWVKFKGDFRAVNLVTGEEFASSNLHLPDVAGDILSNAMLGDDIESIEFAFDLSVRVNDTPIGYEYTATPLVEVEESDPLLKLAANLPKLAAPKAAK